MEKAIILSSQEHLEPSADLYPPEVWVVAMDKPQDKKKREERWEKDTTVVL